MAVAALVAVMVAAAAAAAVYLPDVRSRSCHGNAQASAFRSGDPGPRGKNEPATWTWT
jgi:hypothetical protein